MTVEFIGGFSHNERSEAWAGHARSVDPAYIETIAKALEYGGFDRALVPFNTGSSESMLVALHAAAHTRRLGFMVAHRPGFVAPTLAARQLATLDGLTGGRIAVHIITGALDAEMRQDGDYLSKAERYGRSEEYLTILKRIWRGETPLSHEGRHYRFEDFRTAIPPVQPDGPPVYFGGASDAAIDIAARLADVYAFWGEPYAETQALMWRVSDAAARTGRTIRFSISLRIILAETEEEAWAKAGRIYGKIKARGPQVTATPDAQNFESEGFRRLQSAAARGDRLDKRLWTAVAGIDGVRGSTTALVGTPDQVAEALLDYYDLGVTTFLIRGFYPLEDAVLFGRDLIPLVRAEIARRDAAAAMEQVA